MGYKLTGAYIGTQQVRPKIPPYLCFTAEAASSTIKLSKSGSPADVYLETSTDWNTWSSYTIWSTITLSNVWDKVYRRSTSETPVTLSSHNTNNYRFSMTWTIAASWDINYLLCKYSTDSLFDYCYVYLFQSCSSLTSSPKLPATTLAANCYRYMFADCTNLKTINILPATTLPKRCYDHMYSSCSSIKLSPTALTNYTQAYRIPSEWTGTTGTNSLEGMFTGTGWGDWTSYWDMPSTPSINTTYYVHKNNIII